MKKYTTGSYGIFFCVWYWCLNSGPTPWATPPALFGDSVSQTICLGWLQTAILLMFASWVARITGMSHQCLVGIFFLVVVVLGLNSGPPNTWAMPTAFYALDFFFFFMVAMVCFGYFWDRLLHLCLGWPGDPLFTLPTYVGWQAHATMPRFYWLEWDLENFLPRLALNHNSSDLCLPRS
jgi:hypothetical protein